LNEFATWVSSLPVGEQLEVVEELLRRLRRNSFTDHAALERQMEEMANDPGMQRVLSGADLLDSAGAGREGEWGSVRAPLPAGGGA
jgi:hypothetical protein